MSLVNAAMAQSSSSAAAANAAHAGDDDDDGDSDREDTSRSKRRGRGRGRRGGGGGRGGGRSKSGEREERRKCFECGKRGHLAVDCPDARQEGAPASRGGRKSKRGKAHKAEGGGSGHGWYARLRAAADAPIDDLLVRPQGFAPWFGASILSFVMTVLALVLRLGVGVFVVLFSLPDLFRERCVCSRRLAVRGPAAWRRYWGRRVRAPEVRNAFFAAALLRSAAGRQAAAVESASAAAEVDVGGGGARNCKKSDKQSVEDLVWCLDSGSTHHLTTCRAALRNVRTLDPPMVFTVADGRECRCVEHGDVLLKTEGGGEITLYNVIHMPTEPAGGKHINLASVPRFTSTGGKVEFAATEAVGRLGREVVFKAARSAQRDEYLLSARTMFPTSNEPKSKQKRKRVTFSAQETVIDAAAATERDERPRAAPSTERRQTAAKSDTTTRQSTCQCIAGKSCGLGEPGWHQGHASAFGRNGHPSAGASGASGGQKPQQTDTASSNNNATEQNKLTKLVDMLKAYLWSRDTLPSAQTAAGAAAAASEGGRADGTVTIIGRPHETAPENKTACSSTCQNTSGVNTKPGEAGWHERHARAHVAPSAAAASAGGAKLAEMESPTASKTPVGAQASKKQQTSNPSVFGPAELQLWHKRLAHVNDDALRRMHDDGIVDGLKGRKHAINCDVCKRAKMTRNRIGSEMSQPRATECFERVHADVVGPFHTVGARGERFLLLITDEYSDMVFAYSLRAKSEVAERVKHWHALVRNQWGARVREFHSDHGGEFISENLLRHWAKHGVVASTTSRDTPQHNGRAERKNRTFVEAMRALLIQAALAPRFWPFAADAVAHLLNRTVRSARRDKTPYEMVQERKPSLAHVRVFG
jgi:transposase InsO family protein